jgi:hypothetical protein
MPILPEIPTPGTPSAGSIDLYAKSDRRIYTKDESGAELLVGAGLYPFTPDDQGMIAWNFDPALVASGTQSMTAGVVNMVAINIPRAATITNVCYVVSVIGSGLSNCWVGLYGPTGTRLALTADQSTNWGATAFRTVAFTSSPAVTPGRYYVAFLGGAGTLPQFGRGGNVVSTATYNAGSTAGASNFRTATILTAQTVLPSSITITSMAASNILPWVGLN